MRTFCDQGFLIIMKVGVGTKKMYLVCSILGFLHKKGDCFLALSQIRVQESLRVMWHYTSNSTPRYRETMGRVSHGPVSGNQVHISGGNFG